jgi:hypothetical protein
VNADRRHKRLGGKTWFSRTFDWPDDNGRCARSARPDISGLTGVHLCHLAIVVGDRLIVPGCRMAPDGGPAPISVEPS